MNTTGRILSIIVFMAIATTALTFGTSTTFAASTQLMSGNYFPTFAATNGHTHHHQNDMIADINGDNSNSTADSGDRGSPTQYELAQYAWSHLHHHHSSTHMIADINGDNSNSTADSGDRGSFSPTQYGSAVSHSHQHHSPTGTIADINSANRGFGGNDDFSNRWANSN
ncbi:MAG: hypothetical protein WBZ36_20395 [Candidatus Nitrosopolaris sp.]